jgi:exopolysaccharide biosynthesis polyprenyl glycosylphosphotransferase
MVPFHRQVLFKAFELLDLLIMSSSFALAVSAAYHYRMGKISFNEFLSMRVSIHNFGIFLGFLVIWRVIFFVFRLYHSKRLSNQWDDIVDVIKATSVASLVVLAASALLQIDIISPVAVFLGVFWTVSTAATVLSRFTLRHVLKRVRLRGRNLRHMLIVGTNPRVLRYVRRIESRPELGYRLVGFVEENWDGIEEFRKTGHELVASFDSLPEFLRSHVVDEIVIGLPLNSFYQQASRIVALCEEQGIIIRFLSNLFDQPRRSPKDVEEFEDNSVITLCPGSIDGWAVVTKRFLDFCFSLVLVIILTPLFLAIAFLIKISSAGPVFFIQERIGLNKRRFHLYKFRTMIPDAENRLKELEHLNEVVGPVFKIKNDPRVTALGRFLRKTSMDELPQLLNVLKGDMSLVGPRPLPVRDFEGFSQDWLRRRFSVRPGITCLWQINGRSGIPFTRWMELDMEYIDQWSLSLDLKILAKTIPAVLKGSGAA